MTYNAGQVILTDEYNVFVQGSDATPVHSVANLNSIWGTGNADKGWGQSGTLSTVTEETITATQWSTLFARMGVIAAQEGNTITGASAVTTGTEIAAVTTLQADITDVFAQRLDNTGYGTSQTASKSDTNWNDFLYHTATITRTSDDLQRYFFNAGGVISISGSYSGGTAHPKNLEWQDLIDKIGTLEMGANTFTKVGGSGAHTITSNGYYDLTGSYVSIFKQFADSSPYTANYIEIFARRAGAIGSNGGNGLTVEIDVRYVDDASDDPANPPAAPQHLVDMNIVTNIDLRPSVLTHISDSWGLASTLTVVNGGKS